ncbi:hypothetical protein QCI77_29550 [Bacillus cereus group sp. MG9]|uniref:hypothetical protein n=1 Tax=Bacillus cereus group sp. MG9 TaxID=3040247 RepID=UPI00339535EC
MWWVQITRIRHAVSIMLSVQLRDRHVLWVDGEHNTFLFFVNVVLENGNGVVVLDWMNIAFLKRKTRIKGFFINFDRALHL